MTREEFDNLKVGDTLYSPSFTPPYFDTQTVVGVYGGCFTIARCGVMSSGRYDEPFFPKPLDALRYCFTVKEASLVMEAEQLQAIRDAIAAEEVNAL